MATRIRLHLDEHVDPALVHALHRRRVDVTTTAEAGLRGASDRDVSHAGIAFYGPKSRSIGSLVRAVMRLWETRGASEVRNPVRFL